MTFADDNRAPGDSVLAQGDHNSEGSGCLAGIDVFVLAGGLGTRIRPVLGDTPKLLAPIAGRAYLAYLLDWLTYFGARRIVFGLGFGSEAIRAELERRRRPDLALVSRVEPEPLGTAGAIRFCRDLLHTDPVLILNGDSFVNANLCDFINFHRARSALGAILCTRVKDGSRYGEVHLNTEGHIEGFVEKSAGPTHAATISAGIYLLSSVLLDTIARSAKASIERDIFPMLPPGTLHAFAGDFEFIDIGTPESLTTASTILRHLPGIGTS